MDTIIEVKNSTKIDNVIKENKLVLVDFWAEWCGPCKALNPVLAELSEEFNKDLVIAKVNVDENKELSVKHSIRSIPTLLLFKDGDLVETKIGASSSSNTKSEIKSIITKHI